MTPSELSDLLWSQVDRVAPHLLPNGKKDGHEWVAGNVHGDKGSSLKVNLNGKKKWADFAEGDGGDMLDLWMACRGISLHQAMQEAKAFLGIRDDDHHFDAKREKKFSRPDRKKVARYCNKTEHHIEYLKSRGISPETAKAFEVVSGKVWNGERELDALVFPYKRDGELIQVKRISTERPNGKKVIMAESDCEPCLFGWQALDSKVRSVVLCEGEIDCMSYSQYGINALSVPFGGGKGAKQQWIEFEFHNLDRFEEIWISMDNDEVGQEAAREIASRLGEHRCRMVKLPRKDINECLMDGVPEDDIWNCLAQASYFDPEELYSAREFYQDTVNAFYGRQQFLFQSPWEALNHNFQFREAELTLVNGVNGHGKACPLDEPILLADGTWTTHGDVKIGDQVASVDGNPSTVTGIFPQGVRDVYRVTFEDGRYVDCAGEHLWEVTSRGFTKGEKRRVIDTFELKRLSETKRHQNGVRVPEITGDFGEHSEPLAWVIGSLLGDGGLSNGSVKFSNVEPYMIERMKAELPDYNFSGDGKDWLISTARGQVNPLMEVLRGYGLMGCKSQDKFIPEAFFTANKRTRIDILCGLMETDGYIEKDGTVVFSSASEKLRDGVVQLVRSLGGSCRTRLKANVAYTYKGVKCKGLDSYEARIRLSREAREAIRSPRLNSRLTAHRFEGCGVFVRSVEKIGEADCLCLMVDHPRHLYVTRDYIATHNTEVVGHMVLEAMRQGVKACVASLELKPGILLKRLTRQATCCKMPPVLEIESAFKFYDDRLWLFGLTGTAKAERLLEIFHYARRRYGIQLFVIDSLMKCGIGDDDYNGQKAFVDALCDFKNKTNSHIILVTHSRKGDSEEKPTGKMDVKGSGAITDLTDNLFIIWRNKGRERALQRVQAGEQLNDKDQQLLAAPASVLMLEKQRNGEGWEGGVPLFLDDQSHQFLQVEGASPYNYVANMPKSEYDEVWHQENVSQI
ncbi:toprim domain-containing protein [Cronobacter malonaticus]